jgi:hypothetical protein
MWDEGSKQTQKLVIKMSFLNSYLERFYQSNIIFIYSFNDVLNSSNYVASNERVIILGKL